MAVQEKLILPPEVEPWNAESMKFPPREHQKYSTTYCNAAISLKSRRDIGNVIAEATGIYLGNLTDSYYELHESHNGFWEWETSEGKWPKRFAKWYKDAYRCKLSNDILGKIGDIAVRSIGDKEYVWDVDYQIGWDAGDFGDNVSCFWTTNRGAKDMLRDNGGFALRLWEPERIYFGMARCWCFDLHEDLHVVWNGYGIGTWEIARLAATIVGGISEKIPLMNNGDSSGTLYINGTGSGIGYLVGTQEAIDARKERRKHPEYVDLKWEDQDEHRMYCTHCNEVVYEDDAYYIDDDTLCDRCCDGHTAICEHCGERRWTDDMSMFGNDYYCEYCFERYFTYCDGCSEVISRDDTQERNDRWYCEDCAADIDEEEKRKAEEEAEEAKKEEVIVLEEG